jgi:hypothetical protein
MRSFFVFIGRRLKQMPMGIHFLLLFCILAPIFALGFYIRGDPKVPVGLPKVLLTAIGSAVFVYGFLLATRWSRPLLMLYLVAGSIWAIFQHHATYSFSDYWGLLGTDGLVAWILYFRRDVRDYCTRAHESVA